MPRHSAPIRLGVYVMRFPVLSETFIVTKVLGLLDAGFDVHIFANRPGEDWDRFAVLQSRPELRSRIHLAPPVRPLWKVLTLGGWYLFSKAIRYPASFWRLVRHCWQHRKENPLGFLKAFYSHAVFVGHPLDVLHVEFDTQALSVVDVKEYLQCKLLLSSRGTFQKTTVLDKFPGAPSVLYRYADGYHFLSDYLREKALQMGMPHDLPYWRIPPAIDLDLFTPPHRALPVGSSHPLHVISVARLAWQKGYEFAIDAIGHLHARGIPTRYTIVGSGSYQEPVIFAARQWNLMKDGVVEFAGAVAREKIPNLLAQADVMLHLPVEEGFCNAVIEAQAMGLPVVASDASGLPENLEDGVTGFIVPRRNPEAAAEKLIHLYEQPALRLKMGEAGKARAKALFDLSQQVADFTALYREMLAGEERRS